MTRLDAPPPGRAARPWRLLPIALIWISAAFAASAVVVATADVLLSAPAYPARLRGGHHIHNSHPGLLGLIGLLSLQCVLLLGALHGAGRRGSRKLGLGFLPIQHIPVVLGLVVVLVLYLIAYFIIEEHINPSSGIIMHTAKFDWWDYVSIDELTRDAAFVSVMLIAPLVEELFFRGWLWASLRRAWGPVPTMVCTALPWMLIHASEGWYKPLLLLPAAVCLSLARQVGGSVRASIAVHVLNNSVAALLLTYGASFLPRV